MDVKPAQSDIIGYVTTGNYSLSRGAGMCIGAMPLSSFVAGRVQAKRYTLAHVSEIRSLTQLSG